MRTTVRSSAAALAAAALLAAGATTTSAAPGDSAGDASRTTSQASTRLTLNQYGRVGSIVLPASAYSVKKQINSRLGYSDFGNTDVPDQCMSEVTGQRWYMTTVSWDDGMYVYGESRWRPVKITSWTITSATASRRMSMPYGVGVGNSYTYLKAKAGWMSKDSSGVFNDGPIYSRARMSWFMSKDGSRVEAVAYNLKTCD